MDQTRSYGREQLLAAMIYCCIGREDVLKNMEGRLTNVYAEQWQGKEGKTVKATKIEQGYGFADAWFPWQESWCVVAHHILATLTRDPVVKALAERLRTELGDSLMLYGWENTRRDPPRWHIASQVSYNGGMPVDPTNKALWNADENTGYIMWGLGASRIMAVYGSTQAVRDRAALAAASVPLDMGADGDLGWRGRYFDWWQSIAA